MYSWHYLGPLQLLIKVKIFEGNFKSITKRAVVGNSGKGVLRRVPGALRVLNFLGSWSSLGTLFFEFPERSGYSINQHLEGSGYSINEYPERSWNWINWVPERSRSLFDFLIEYPECSGTQKIEYLERSGNPSESPFARLSFDCWSKY